MTELIFKVNVKADQKLLLSNDGIREGDGQLVDKDQEKENAERVRGVRAGSHVGVIERGWVEEFDRDERRGQ